NAATRSSSPSPPTPNLPPQSRIPPPRPRIVPGCVAVASGRSSRTEYLPRIVVFTRDDGRNDPDACGVPIDDRCDRRDLAQTARPMPPESAMMRPHDDPRLAPRLVPVPPPRLLLGQQLPVHQDR